MSSLTKSTTSSVDRSSARPSLNTSMSSLTKSTTSSVDRSSARRATRSRRSGLARGIDDATRSNTVWRDDRFVVSRRRVRARRLTVPCVGRSKTSATRSASVACSTRAILSFKGNRVATTRSIRSDRTSPYSVFHSVSSSRSRASRLRSMGARRWKTSVMQTSAVAAATTAR